MFGFLKNNKANNDMQGDVIKQQAYEKLARGMLENGNIDLYDRPVVTNNDGSISTVRTIGFQPSEGDYAGKQVLIPTVSNDGQILSNEDAINNFNNTGQHLGVFNNVRNANKYAKNLHNEQDKYYSSPEFGAKQALTDYQNYIKSGSEPSAQNAIKQYGADAVVSGIANGLNYGVPAIADWQKQYNQGAGRVNPINFPTTPEQIEQAKQGQLMTNDAIQGGVADKSTAYENVLSKLMNGLGDFGAGFNENFNNSFKPENLQPDNKKGVMNRLGEAVGTAGRIAQSDIGRGLIVGGLVGATGGNPAQMLGYGARTTTNSFNNRTNNALYRQQLKNLGYTDEQINAIQGYVDGKNFNNLSNSIYRQRMNNVAQQNANTNVMNAVSNANYKKGQLKINQQNANTNSFRAKNDASYKNTMANVSQRRVKAYEKDIDNKIIDKQEKERVKREFSEDLGDFYGIQDEEEREIARQAFISTYGKDPYTFIKDVQY